MATPGKPWQFWIDVGGTFTDCLARRPDGTIKTHKLLSTGIYKGRILACQGRVLTVDGRRDDPEDFFVGYTLRIMSLRGIEKPKVLTKGLEITAFDPRTGTLEVDQDLEVDDRLQSTSSLLYEIVPSEEAPVVAIRWFKGLRLTDDIGEVEVRLGTTKGTNALLEKRGAKTVFITTKGFQDVLSIGYQNRPRLFDLHIKKPLPLYGAVVEADERLDANGKVLRPLALDPLENKLAELKQDGFEAVAICLLHAHKNSEHEELIAQTARRLGFSQVSLSSQLAALQRVVPRADTTVVDAYLTPVIRDYVDRIRAAMPKASLKLMTSAGGLVDAELFVGKDSVLSGPAGGVVGVANVARFAAIDQAIGFDMGGTSTDVCRFAGDYERRFEMEIQDPEKEAGVRIVAPMLAIETVAAGGGSICSFDGIRLKVGPESAGADPGPACYGRGGPLTITDCNVFLGRVLPEHFSFPLDRAAVEGRLRAMADEMRRKGIGDYDLPQLASGFLAVAASSMAAPIKKISVAKGYDVRSHTMISFGGAGAQHACQVAEQLGISSILQHPYASILSAYGIGQADIRKFSARDVGAILDDHIGEVLDLLFDQMAIELRNEMTREGVDERSIEPPTKSLDLRYQGQDAIINVKEPTDGNYRRVFEEQHRRLYGFCFAKRPVEVRSARMELISRTSTERPHEREGTAHEAKPEFLRKVWTWDRWQDVPVFFRDRLQPGAKIQGVALIVEAATTVFLTTGWTAVLTPIGDLLLTFEEPSHGTKEASLDISYDPVRLALFNHQFMSIAEQMGAALQRTSLSVNVKERLDFSCAIFTAEGGLVVNAPHIPVHLGSMGDTVRSLIGDVGLENLRPGDVYVTNDPYRGGSHLPDVTVISPVFDQARKKLLFFVGNRAHHAEIGGISPGSMPPFSKTLAEEGVLITNFRLVRGEQVREEELRGILAGAPYPSRAPDDNLADIRAQSAANSIGRQLLLDMTKQHGTEVVEAYMDHIRSAASQKMQEALGRLDEGRYQFEDQMDDGTRIVVSIAVGHGDHPSKNRALVDFTGTGAPSSGNLNAGPAIVKAAVMYCFRCLIGEDIPLNEGVLAPIEVRIPTPSVLSPSPGENPAGLAAVVGGNVETSQRVVDVIFGALGVVAASHGTMNNLLFGRPASGHRPGFGYYETICGGSGAGPTFRGADAVHTHMTNTRITDPEVLEERFPVRLKRFAVRTGSGGRGHHPGGDGVIRELEFLETLDLSLLTSRRTCAPFGLRGGHPGARGRNRMIRANGDAEEELAAMAYTQAHCGDVLILETPGGGGFGRA